jgi:hypothetical protein
MTAAMIHATTAFAGLKWNEDGPLRRWGKRFADRRSCHHAASAIAKTPSATISACTVKT